MSSSCESSIADYPGIGSAEMDCLPLLSSMVDIPRIYYDENLLSFKGYSHGQVALEVAW